jgi:hypothetical protein
MSSRFRTQTGVEDYLSKFKASTATADQQSSEATGERAQAAFDASAMDKERQQQQAAADAQAKAAQRQADAQRRAALAQEDAQQDLRSIQIEQQRLTIEPDYKAASDAHARAKAARDKFADDQIEQSGDFWVRKDAKTGGITPLSAQEAQARKDARRDAENAFAEEEKRFQPKNQEWEALQAARRKAEFDRLKIQERRLMEKAGLSPQQQDPTAAVTPENLPAPTNATESRMRFYADQQQARMNTYADQQGRPRTVSPLTANLVRLEMQKRAIEARAKLGDIAPEEAAAKIEAATTKQAQLTEQAKEQARTSLTAKLQGQDPAAIAAAPPKPAPREALSKALQEAKLFSSATAAMGQATDKGIRRRPDGNWDLPAMTPQRDNIIEAAVGGIVQTVAQKSGARLDFAGMGDEQQAIQAVFHKFQQDNNLSDEEVQAAWADLGNINRKFGKDETHRVLSDGSLHINEANTAWLDPNKARGIIARAKTTPEAKRQAEARLPERQETMAKAKAEAYDMASGANVFGNDVPAFSSFAKKQGGDLPAAVKAYEDRYLNKRGKGQIKLDEWEAAWTAGKMNVIETVLGLAGMAGIEPASQGAAAFSEASQGIKTGAGADGIDSAVIEQIPALGMQVGLARGAGAVVGAATKSAKAAQAAGSVTAVVTSGAQSAGMTYADERANGTSHEEAQEKARKSGINTAVITGIFQVAGLGGVEKVAAGKAVGEVTMRDILGSTTKAELATNTRRFAANVLKATAGEATEEGIDELTQAFIIADPDTNLADAWGNAIEAAKIGGLIGGVVETGSKAVGSGTTPEQRHQQQLASIAQRIQTDAVNPDLVADAIAEIDPTERVPTPDELKEARQLVAPDQDAFRNHQKQAEAYKAAVAAKDWKGARAIDEAMQAAFPDTETNTVRDTADAVLLVRELGEQDVVTKDAFNQAQAAFNEAMVSGDREAKAMAGPELAAARSARQAHLQTRAAVKIASGMEITALTDAEARAMGFTREADGGLAPMKAKELADNGLTAPLMRPAADGSAILTDDVVATVRATSERAGRRVKLNEQEAADLAQKRFDAANTPPPATNEQDQQGQSQAAPSPQAPQSTPTSSESPGGTVRDGTGQPAAASSDGAGVAPEAAVQEVEDPFEPTAEDEAALLAELEAEMAGEDVDVNESPVSATQEPEASTDAPQAPTPEPTRATPESIRSAKQVQANIQAAVPRLKGKVTTQDGTRPSGGVFIGLDGRMTISPRDIAGEMQRNGWDEATATRILTDLAVSHEVAHIAQVDALRARWKEEKPRMSFETYFLKFYGEQYAEMGGKGGQIDIEAANIYDPTAGNPQWQSLSAGQKGAEIFRMFLENKLTGTTSELSREIERQGVTKGFIQLIKDAIAYLKGVIDTLPDQAKAHLEELEAFYRELTLSPASQSDTTPTPEEAITPDAGESPSKPAKKQIDSPARREAFRLLRSGELIVIDKIIGGKIQAPPTGMLKIAKAALETGKATQKQRDMLDFWDNAGFNQYIPKYAFGTDFNGKVAQELHGMLFTQDKSNTALDDWAGLLGDKLTNDEAMLEVMGELTRISKGITTETDARNPNKEEAAPEEIAAAEAEAKAGKKEGTTQAKQDKAFDAAQANPSDAAIGMDAADFSPDMIGGTITVDGEPMLVADVETDSMGITTAVVLQNGKRFGRQVLEDGEVVFVEEDAPEVEAEPVDDQVRAEESTPVDETPSPVEETAAEKFDRELRAERRAERLEMMQRPIAQQSPKVWYDEEAAKRGIGPDELTADEIRVYKGMWNSARKAALAKNEPVIDNMQDDGKPPKKGYVRRGDIWYPPTQKPASPGKSVENLIQEYRKILPDWRSKEDTDDDIKFAMRTIKRLAKPDVNQKAATEALKLIPEFGTDAPLYHLGLKDVPKTKTEWMPDVSKRTSPLDKEDFLQEMKDFLAPPKKPDLPSPITYMQLNARFRGVDMPKDITARYNKVYNRLGAKGIQWLANTIRRDAKLSMGSDNYFPIIADLEANVDLAERYREEWDTEAPTSAMDRKNTDAKELFADDGGFKLGQETTTDGAKVAAERKAKEEAKAAADAAQRSLFDEGPTLTPEEQALKDALEGLFASRSRDTGTPDLFAPENLARPSMKEVKTPSNKSALGAYRALTAKKQAGKTLKPEEEQDLLEAETALGQKMAFDMAPENLKGKDTDLLQAAIVEATMPQAARSMRAVQQSMFMGEEGRGGQQSLFSSASPNPDFQNLRRSITTELTKTPSQYQYEPTQETRPDIAALLEKSGLQRVVPTNLRLDTDQLEEISGAQVVFVREQNPIGLVSANTLSVPRVIIINADTTAASVGYLIAHEMTHVAQKVSAAPSGPIIKRITELASKEEITAMFKTLLFKGYDNNKTLITAEIHAHLVADAVAGTNTLGLQELANREQLTSELVAYFDSLPRLNPDARKGQLFAEAAESPPSGETLRSSASPAPDYSAPIPPAVIAKMWGSLTALVESGQVTSPETLAATLKKFGPGAPKLSQGLWSIISAVKGEAPTAPDWAGIYGASVQTPGDGQQVQTGEGAGDVVAGGGESRVAVGEAAEVNAAQWKIPNDYTGIWREAVDAGLPLAQIIEPPAGWKSTPRSVNVFTDHKTKQKVARFEHFFIHPDGRHGMMIEQDISNGVSKPIVANVMTRDNSMGVKGWDIAKNQFDGTVEQVVKEIQRRNDYINMKEGKEGWKLETQPASSDDTAETYAKSVQRNLKHMGTKGDEWSVVPFTGREIENPEGGRPMIEQDYLSVQGAGWKQAPTLYPGTSQSPACGWCGKAPVKYLFGIKNDSKKWSMMVGSECITHFSEKSGDAQSQEAKASFNRAAWQSLDDSLKEIKKELSTSTSDSYYRYTTTWSSKAASDLYEQGTKLRGKLSQKDSSDGAFTSWQRKNGQAVEALVTKIRDELQADDAKKYRVRKREGFIRNLESEITNGKSSYGRRYPLSEADIERNTRQIEAYKKEIAEITAPVAVEADQPPTPAAKESLTTETRTTEAVEASLSESEKQQAAVELGHKSWTPEARKSFLSRLADWMVSGVESSAKLAAMFAKVVKRAALSVVVAVSITSTTAPTVEAISASAITNQSPAVPFAKETQEIGSVMQPTVIPRKETTAPSATSQTPSASFGSQETSDNVRVMADWVMGNRDNRGKPFTIADKTEGSIYFFDGTGTLVEAAPAIYGSAKGDVLSERQLRQGIASTRANKADQITPAGRFETATSKSRAYGEVVPVMSKKAGSRIAIHKVFLGRESTEKRQRRLSTPTGADNRISLGCINVPASVAKSAAGLFREGGIVYVLPETKAGKELFSGFEALDTKQTDKGTALFSSASPSQFPEVETIAKTSLTEPPNKYEYEAYEHPSPQVRQFLQINRLQGYRRTPDSSDTRRIEEITGATIIFVRGTPKLTLGRNSTTHPRIVAINTEYPMASVGYGIVHELVHVAQKDSSTQARSILRDIRSLLSTKEVERINGYLHNYGYGNSSPEEVAAEFQAFLVADAVMGTNYIGIDNLQKSQEMKYLLRGFFSGLPRLSPNNGIMELFSSGNALFSSASRNGQSPYSAPIPPAVIAKMWGSLTALVESGQVTSPESLAATLKKFGPGAPKLSQGLWSIISAVKGEAPTAPDWAGIYGASVQTPGDGQQVQTGEGAGDVVAGGGESRVAVGEEAVKESLTTETKEEAPEPGTPDFRLLPTEDKKEIVQKKRKAASAEKAGINDFGEKIGGARKDMSIKTGEKTRPKKTNDKPGWFNRYEVNEVVAETKASSPLERYWMQSASAKQEESAVGRFVINDKRKLDWSGKPERATRQTFATREEAEAAIPLLEASRNHKLRRETVEGADQWGIWRIVSDRKRVQVVKQTFATENEAREFLAKNAADIIETKTSWREELIVKPEKPVRKGPERRNRPADKKMFEDAFGFRGVEFGNWMRQAGDGKERQEVLNHAYDGLLDLVEILNIPPKAISLNGDLGLAFGARGQGLSGAKAHYEPDYVVINLTKMSGAGSLAHEWIHSLDHYLGRQDGRASSEWIKDASGSRIKKPGGPEQSMVSHGFSRKESKVREEVRNAFTRLMDTIMNKSVEFVEDSNAAERFVERARTELEKKLGSLRKDYTRDPDPRWEKRRKPATEAQLAVFDAMADRFLNGMDLETDWRPVDGKARLNYRWTNDALETLNALHKAITNRSGFNKDGGQLDHLRQDMKHYAVRIKMLESAQSTDTKTRKVPTAFSMNAKAIDQGSLSDYWNLPHEMLARGFSAYVEDKIAATGGSSDFLSYGSDNRLPKYRIFNVKPFPEGTEREAINSAFDNLFNILDTKETDKGTALFSSASPARRSDPILDRIKAMVADPDKKAETYVRAARYVSDVRNRFDTGRLKREFSAQGIDSARYTMIRDVAILEAIVKALPKEMRGKFVGKFRNVAEMKTEKGRERYMLAMLPKVEKALEAHLQTLYRQDIRKVIDKSKPKPNASRNLRGKIGASGHAIVKQAVSAMTLKVDTEKQLEIATDALANVITETTSDEVQDIAETALDRIRRAKDTEAKLKIANEALWELESTEDDANIAAIVNQATNAMLLDTNEALTLAAAHREKIEIGTKRVGDDDVPLTLDEWEELEGKAVALELFSDYENASSARLAKALEFLKGVYSESREQWLKVLKERKAQKEDDIETLRKTIKAPDFITNEMLAAAKKKSEKIVHRFGTAMLEWISSYEQILGQLKENTQDPQALAWVDEQVAKLRDARGEYDDKLEGERVALEEAMADIFGTGTGWTDKFKLDPILHGLSTRREDHGVTVLEGVSKDTIPVPVKLAESLVRKETSTYTHNGVKYEIVAQDMVALEEAWERFQELPDEAQGRKPLIYFTRVKSEGKRNTIGAYSQLEMLKEWLAMRQADLAKKYESRGWDETTMEQLESALTPEVKRLGLWLVDRLESQRSELDAKHRSEYGIGLDLVDNYFPALFENAQSQDSNLGPDGVDTNVAAKTASALKGRVAHNARPRQMNALSVFLSNRAQVHYFMTHATPLREMVSMFRATKSNESLRVTLGENYTRNLGRELKLIETNGMLNADGVLEAEKFMRKVQSGFALGVLGLNIGTIMINTTAMLNTLLGVPAKELLSGLSPEYVGDVKRFFDSPAIQRRLKHGTSHEIRIAAQGGIGSRPLAAGGRRVAQTSMQGINWWDTFSNSVLGALAYRATLVQARKAGMSEADAVAAAEKEIDRLSATVMQPNNMLSRSLGEVKLSQNPIGGLLFMFATEPRKNFAIGMYAARKLITGKGAVSKGMAAQQLIVLGSFYSAFAYLIRSLVMAAFKAGDDEPEDMWERMIARLTDGKGWTNAILTEHLKGFPLIGEAASRLIGGVINEAEFIKGERIKQFDTSNNILNRGVAGVFKASELADSDLSPEQKVKVATQAIQATLGMFPETAFLSQAGNVARDGLGLLTSNGMEFSTEERVRRMKARFSKYRKTLPKPTDANGKIDKLAQMQRDMATVDYLRRERAKLSPEQRKAFMAAIDGSLNDSVRVWLME